MDIRVLASSSRGNCYHVSDGSTPLLLECGIKFAEIRKGVGFQVSTLGGCLVTHEHQDHARAAADLMGATVDVYASRGTAEALSLTGHHLIIIEPLRQFRIGTWTVKPFHAVHDAAEPLGFLLASAQGEKLLYLTDSAYCPYRFDGLTCILIECNHSVDLLRRNVQAGIISPEHKNRVLRNHMSIERLLQFLAANDLGHVQEIHLIHLSDQNSDAAEFKRAVAAATGKPVYVADA